MSADLLLRGRRRTVQEQLQDLGDIALYDDDGTARTWDLYRPDEKDKLEAKVRFALFPESLAFDMVYGQPTKFCPTDSESESKNTRVLHITDKIWDQMKHTGGACLRMSMVHIALVNANSQSPLSEENYMIRPLFRTMKCLDPSSLSVHGKCMVFVDEFGWVYQNWKAFTEETLYPDTMIVAPANGVFSRDDSGHVELFYFKAPKTAEKIEMEKLVNISMTVCGLGSAAVLGAAAVFPLKPFVVWGALGIGAVVGFLNGIKSIVELENRKYHEQTISFADNEALVHWLAILGMVNVASSGLSSATAGKVSEHLLLVNKFVGVSSIFINGFANNKIYTVLSDDRSESSEGILHISGGLVLFTHSCCFHDPQGLLFDLLKKMAEMILVRLGSRVELPIEEVRYNCFKLIRERAEEMGVSFSEILMPFCGANFEISIPRFVQDWFDVFIITPGTLKCGVCGGAQYQI